MDIFCDEADYRFFLYRLKENLFSASQRGTLLQEGAPLEPKQRGYTRKTLPSNAFGLLCYCLMPNHFHFLVCQNGILPVGKLISKICTGYSMYFNKKYERVGSLFQNTFKAVLVDSDSYLMWLSAYIHQNPKVAGLVSKLENYQWSSYPDYIGQRKGTLCEKNVVLEQFSNVEAYRKFVEDSFDKIKDRKGLEYLLLD